MTRLRLTSSSSNNPLHFNLNSAQLIAPCNRSTPETTNASLRLSLSFRIYVHFPSTTLPACLHYARPSSCLVLLQGHHPQPAISTEFRALIESTPVTESPCVVSGTKAGVVWATRNALSLATWQHPFPSRDSSVHLSSFPPAVRLRHMVMDGLRYIKIHCRLEWECKLHKMCFIVSSLPTQPHKLNRQHSLLRSECVL